MVAKDNKEKYYLNLLIFEAILNAKVKDNFFFSMNMIYTIKNEKY